jgi:serine/threonine protein kinase
MDSKPPEPVPTTTGAGNPPEDWLPAGTRMGEFEILAVVGMGGFGIVYRAFDHDLEREVAVKEYMPGMLANRNASGMVTTRSRSHAETFGLGLRSFVNEARLLARFDHPALLRVFRFWEANGTAYMAMPFYEGQTLAAALKALGEPPTQAWLMAIIEPLLGALELLHGQQVFHRDIAPDNILLLPSGMPVLLDFGAARRVITDRTQTLTAILKPNYAPIEQYAEVSGLRQGPWTDFYALAAVVYSAINGRPPAPAATRAVVDESSSFAEIGERLQASHGLSFEPGFLATWQRCLALKPADRPQDVAELRRLLGLPEVSPSKGPAPVWSKPPTGGAATPGTHPPRRTDPATGTDKPASEHTGAPANGGNTPADDDRTIAGPWPTGAPLTAPPLHVAQQPAPASTPVTATDQAPGQPRKAAADRADGLARTAAPAAVPALKSGQSPASTSVATPASVPPTKPTGSNKLPMVAALALLVVVGGYFALAGGDKRQVDGVPAVQSASGAPVPLPAASAASADFASAAPAVSPAFSPAASAIEAPPSGSASVSGTASPASGVASRPAGPASAAPVAPKPAVTPSVVKPVTTRPAPSKAASAAVAAPVVEVPPEPTPLQVCGARMLVARWTCMQRECAKPQFADSADCKEERERAERDKADKLRF